VNEAKKVVPVVAPYQVLRAVLQDDPPAAFFPSQKTFVACRFGKASIVVPVEGPRGNSDKSSLPRVFFHELEGLG
jgi:hypothetical protein